MSLTSVEGESEVGFGAGHHHDHHAAPLCLRAVVAETRSQIQAALVAVCQLPGHGHGCNSILCSCSTDL